MKDHLVAIRWFQPWIAKGTTKDHLMATKWFQPWSDKDHLVATKWFWPKSVKDMEAGGQWVVSTLDYQGEYQGPLGGH